MIFFSQKYLQNIQPLHNIFEPKVRISSRTRIFQQKNVNRSCDTATLSDQPCKYDLTFVGLWECGLHGAVFVRSPTWAGAPPLMAQGRVHSQKSVKKIARLFWDSLVFFGTENCTEKMTRKIVGNFFPVSSRSMQFFDLRHLLRNSYLGSDGGSCSIEFSAYQKWLKK